MSFAIGGTQYYEPTLEAGFLTAQMIHQMATEWIANIGKMPKYLFLSADDWNDYEVQITQAVWQYSRDWENVIEPVWDRRIPRGVMTMLSADQYLYPGYTDEVVKMLISEYGGIDLRPKVR